MKPSHKRIRIGLLERHLDDPDMVRITEDGKVFRYTTI